MKSLDRSAWPTMATAAALSFGFGLVLVLQTAPAAAGGFFAPYQSGPALGAALAGATARNDDPSFLFFNPASAAGTTRTTTAIGAQVFMPSIKLEAENAISPLGADLTADGSSGEMAETAFAPSLAAAIPIARGLVLGITGSAPFAAKIETDPNWAGRFHLLRTDMQAMNVTASLSYQLTPWLAIGAGVQAQRFKGEFEKTELFPLDETMTLFGEARGYLTGKDWGFGALAGIVLTPAEGTRIGIAYRSQVRHEFNGKAGLFLPFAPSQSARYELVTPDVVSIGLEQRITPQLRLFAEAQWVNWSVFKGFNIALGNGDTDSRPLEWDDTYMGAIGFGYMLHPDLELTAGIHYDTAVTKGGNTFSPDSNRIMVGVGLAKSFGEAGTLSLHYAHLFFEGSTVDVADIRTGALQAEFDGSLDIFGLTYTKSW